jgi:hypothetical protein
MGCSREFFKQGVTMNRSLRIRGSIAALLMLAICASTGAAESQSKLRSSIAKVDKQYIELYNKLNTESQYEIVCRNEKTTGTNYASRVCRARYLRNAMENASSERMRSAFEPGSNSSPNNTAANPGIGGALTGTGMSGMDEKDEAFRQHLIAVMQKNPELQELGKQRAALQQQIDEVTGSKASK